MAAMIEDYALLGDTRTSALVSKDGSVDWLCPGRFDAPACLAALLGGSEHGRWLLAPDAPARSVRRHYRDDTLVLETDYETADGAVTVIDTMAPGTTASTTTLVRLVVGRRGQVPMRMQLTVRFGYGMLRPWLRRDGDDLVAISGPDALRLTTPAEVATEDGCAEATLTVREGQRLPFVLTWYPSHESAPPHADPEQVVADSARWWQDWADRCTYSGEWRDAVVRSLITLKALTYAPTGGLIAAPTTSLPEGLGGDRNWDYRYCWLRDATLALAAMYDAGYVDEALAWREWLLRTIAGDPAQMQIVYGPAGERHLPEWHADWLPGYENSRPVRIGNAATAQFQLDVAGELADAQHQLVLERGFFPGQEPAIAKMLDYLESAWPLPDQGIWESRAQPRQFTYSKVMAWVGFDRAVKLAGKLGLPGPVDRWRDIRDQIHAEVCDKGYDSHRGTFVQFYGGQELDASLLRMPAVGFLPGTDPRVTGTIDAIRRELEVGHGLLLRYSPSARGSVDGIDGDEGAFLACSFWLVDALALGGRLEEARELFGHLLEIRNDVGLLAEEYDPKRQRQTGNFPQALSHLALVNTALLLSRLMTPDASGGPGPDAGQADGPGAGNGAGPASARSGEKPGKVPATAGIG